MLQTKITFIFPITNFTTNPPKHFTNLTVTAHGSIGRLDKVLDVKVSNIAYIKNGETFGANIDTLLQVIAPEWYRLICEAAFNNVKSSLQQEV